MTNKIQCPNCNEYRMMDKRRAGLLIGGALCLPLILVWIFVALISGASIYAATDGTIFILIAGCILLAAGAKERAHSPMTCMKCGYQMPEGYSNDISRRS